MNAPRLGGERNPREAKTMVRRGEREREEESMSDNQYTHSE